MIVELENNREEHCIVFLKVMPQSKSETDPKLSFTNILEKDFPLPNNSNESGVSIHKGCA